VVAIERDHPRVAAIAVATGMEEIEMVAGTATEAVASAIGHLGFSHGGVIRGGEIVTTGMVVTGMVGTTVASVGTAELPRVPR
jgi:hypothetical protein